MCRSPMEVKATAMAQVNPFIALLSAISTNCARECDGRVGQPQIKEDASVYHTSTTLSVHFMVYRPLQLTYNIRETPPTDCSLGAIRYASLSTNFLI